MMQDPSIFFNQFEQARMTIIAKFGNNSGYDAKKANLIHRKSKVLKEEEVKLSEQMEVTIKNKKKNAAHSELENADQNAND